MFAQPLLTGLSLVDPCIISGGTQICDPSTGEILWQCDIDRADVTRVLETFAKTTYGVVTNDYSEADYYDGGTKAGDIEVNGPLFVINCLFVMDNDAAPITKELDKIDGITYSLTTSLKSGRRDIYVTSREATKEHAVAELLSRIGVEAKDATGFGDGMNDTHLFSAVGRKIAMGNARQELKDAADEVIGTVQDDGLAKYFEGL